MANLSMSLSALLAAARLAAVSGDYDRAAELDHEYATAEREYSERLGAEMLAEGSGSERSDSPGVTGSLCSWSWRRPEGDAGNSMSGLSEPGSAETAQGAVGASLAAHAPLRDAVVAGSSYPASHDGTRLYFWFWPQSAGLPPRSAPVPPDRASADCGQLFCEVLS